MNKLVTVIVAVLGSAVLAQSVYECYPIEPEPGEMVVCPMEGLEPAYSGEFGVTVVREPVLTDEMNRDLVSAVWERLLDELREEFGAAEVAEDVFVERLIDALREAYREMGIEVGRIEVEKIEQGEPLRR